MPSLPNTRLEAAAEAATGYCGAGWPAQAYEGEVEAALEAADEVMFSEGAVARAVDAVAHDWPFYDNYHNEDVEKVVRAVVDALRATK